MRYVAAAFAAIFLGALAPIAIAQTPAATPTTSAPPAFNMADLLRVRGVVTAISATQVVVRAADGTSQTIALTPGWMTTVARPVPASSIRPGDFVATANTNVTDTSGQSTELRVFPAGVRGGEGSRPMGEGVTMTNGDVAQVTDNANGRELVVRYAGGERHIQLNSNIVVVGQTRGPQDLVHVGAPAQVIARRMDGVWTANSIVIGENGAAPPGR